jgi:hypothetical protein
MSHPGEQLDLAGGMPDGIIGSQAGRYLLEGIKLVFIRACGARFQFEIAFWQLGIIRAKNAITRTGERFGQHGHGGDPGKRADGLHADLCQQLRIALQAALLTNS